MSSMAASERSASKIAAGVLQRSIEAWLERGRVDA